MEIFALDKGIWTHDDFEEMGWHDSKIYGMTIEKMIIIGPQTFCLTLTIFLLKLIP